MSVTREDVLKALGRVIDEGTGTDVVALDWVRAPVVDGATVRFILEVPGERARELEPLLRACEAAVGALPGVESAAGILTAHGPVPAAPPAAAKAPPAGEPPSLKIGRHDKPQPERRIPGVARILAVGSGKGGVGKSTVSSNLAVTLARQGRRVGLLDADLHGPSQPRMMGVSGRPTTPDGTTISPKHAHGVTVMSLGLMVEEKEPVIWRGPMLMGALQQLMTQVAWGDLDVLVIDLPPGTGDVSLSLCQKFDVDGAVIVSTPQDVALLDARKALAMFRKLNTPVAGLVENMSGFVCPKCGEVTEIFGHGGAEKEAEDEGIPFLGALPLSLETRLAGDAGTPVCVAAPDGPQSTAYAAIAEKLVAAGVA